LREHQKGWLRGSNKMYGQDINYEVVLYKQCYNELFKDFNCGNEELNKHLSKAEQFCDEGFGVTRLIIDIDKGKLIGYYVLSATSLLYDTKDITKVKGLPAIEINIFAMDLEYQKLPTSENFNDGVFSDDMFSITINDIYDISYKYIGAKFITLHSVPKAIKFYKRNGFKELEPIMVSMYDRYLDGCVPMYFKL
jgi:hypothetical protein